MNNAPSTPTKNPTIGFSILIALLGFGLFGLFLVFLAPAGQVESLDEKRASERWEIRKTVDAEQERLTTEYGWIDQEAGRAHVPEGVVMAKVLEDLRGKPIRASNMAVDPAAALVDGVVTDATSVVVTPAADGGTSPGEGSVEEAQSESQEERTAPNTNPPSVTNPNE